MVLNIIRYFYYALFIVTPLVIYSRTSELFEFNKMIFIYFCTGVITSLWLLYQLQNKKLSIKLHWLYIPFGIFLFALFLATLFSIDIHTSIFGYYGRFNGGLFSIVCYLLLAFIFIQVSDREHTVKTLQFAFYTALVTVLWGIPGRFGHDMGCFLFTGELTNGCWSEQFQPADRMFSTLGQPNWLGAYLVVTLFIGIGLLVFSNIKITLLKYKFPPWALIAAGNVLLFFGVIATRSRSAMLALACGIILTALFTFVKQRKTALANWKVLAGIGAICLVVTLTTRTGIPVIDNIIGGKTNQSVQTVSQSDSQTQPESATSGVTESFDIRKIVWEGAIELGKRYPVLGTGPETFAYAYYFTRPFAHNYTSEWDFLYNKAHNEFLNYFATTGYIGLITYLIMIISVLYTGIRVALAKRTSKVQWLVTGLIVGYLTISITNFFGFSISMIQLFFYLIPAMVLILSVGEFQTKEFILHYKPAVLNPLKGGAVLLLVLWSIFIARYFFADIQFATADTFQRSGEYQSAFVLYQNALTLRYEHVYEDKLSSNLANLAFISSYENPELSSELITNAKAFNTRTLQVAPMNVLYWKTRAKNYYLFYQITLDEKNLEEAIKSMEQAGKLSPTDPKVPYTTALFYSLAADEASDSAKKTELNRKAVSEIEKSVLMKSNYDEAIQLRESLKQKEQ